MQQHGWRAFDAAYRENNASILNNFSDLGAQMASQRPPSHPGDVLAGFGYLLAEVGALSGAEAVRPHCMAALPLLDQACADLNVDAPGRVPTVVGLLSLRVTLRNVLGDTIEWPPRADGLGLALAQRRIRPDPHYLQAAAWSTWALGDHDASMMLLPARPIEAEPLSPPRDPTTRLLFARAGRPEGTEARLASWSLLLDDLPMMLETRAMTWGLLQAVGAARHASLARGTGGMNAAAWIHAAVRGRLVG